MPEIIDANPTDTSYYHLKLHSHNEPFNDMPRSHSPLAAFKRAAAYITWLPRGKITLQNTALLQLQ